MKSARLTCVTGLALFTLLTFPVQLTAQQHRVDGLSSLPQDTQASVSAAMGRDFVNTRHRRGVGDSRPKTRSSISRRNSLHRASPCAAKTSSGK